MAKKKVLFLPSLRTWEMPRQVPNVYKPLADTKFLRRFCELQTRNQQIFYAHPQSALQNTEYLRNDAEACKILDIYFTRQKERRDRGRK